MNININTNIITNPDPDNINTNDEINTKLPELPVLGSITHFEDFLIRNLLLDNTISIKNMYNEPYWNNISLYRSYH